MSQEKKPLSPEERQDLFLTSYREQTEALKAIKTLIEQMPKKPEEEAKIERKSGHLHDALRPIAKKCIWCGEELNKGEPEYECVNCGLKIYDPKSLKYCPNCGSTRARRLEKLKV